MSRCWFGQGEENAQECACRRKALGCAVARQMNKREFCLAEHNDCWDRTNTELFLRSEQESKARETTCSLARKKSAQPLFPEHPCAITAPKCHLLSTGRKLHSGIVSKAPGMYKSISIKEMKRQPLKTTNNKATSKKTQTTKTSKLQKEVFQGATELSLHFMTVT